MNNTKSSSKEQVCAHARQVELTVMLKRAFVRFPSYLHVFDFFFPHSPGGSHRAIAPSHLGFTEQFPTR
ncbi:MAG TPA: hypothetical protein VK562_03995, partial [Candidatus Acidoferrum sp.]|nr:hypothetical protein [Candidatus Acidoferrum sp.]